MLHIHPTERLHRLIVEKLKYHIERLQTGLIHFKDSARTREISFQWIRPHEDIVLIVNYAVPDAAFVVAVEIVAMTSNCSWLLSMLKVNGYPRTIRLNLRESLIFWCVYNNAKYDPSIRNFDFIARERRGVKGGAGAAKCHGRRAYTRDLAQLFHQTRD